MTVTMVESDVNTSTVGQLLALLAHDLRNPLSAIHSNIGFLAAILEGRDDEVSDALTDGLISCDGLSHIIDNIDLLGHVLREASSPPRAPFEVCGLVADVVSRCGSVAQSHRITLQYAPSVAESDLPAVYGARDIIGKALGNLIRNCVQHSAPGQTVVVRTERTANGVRVCVEDRGTPIPEAEQEHLFTAEGQVRAKSSADGRYSRGLGLYAARLAAELGGAGVALGSNSDGANVLALELRKPPQM